MSEAKELVVIEKQNAMAVFTNNDKMDPIIEAIEKEARSLVPDISTKKGRDAIASMAHKVARSKTYIDNAGKELVAELKDLPKQIDESRRIVRERLDALRDEVRKPLNDWEAEQERIKAEEEAKAAAEALRIQVENDHEIALLMNEKFDRDTAEKAAEAERNRIAYEEEIKRQAAEAAAREAEQRAQREREEAAHREAVLKAQAEQAERDRIASEQKAEADKQEAIEAERRKAKEEADRVRLEAEQREQARMAEQKRIADEEAKRIANIEHCRGINQQAVADLVKAGVTEDCAKKCVAAIAKSLVSNITIKY